MTAWWRPISLLPMALASFHVLRLYVESGVSVFAVGRALIVAVVLSLTVWVIASVVLRDRAKGTLVATGVVLGVFGWRIVVTTIEVLGNFGWRSVPGLALIGLLVVAVTVLIRRLLQREFPWRLVIPAGNALSLILLLAVVIRAGQNGTLSQLPRDVGWATAAALRVNDRPDPGSLHRYPDIYMVMLEDYPRADVLERLFGFDNSAFLSGLRERGFVVSPRARSNYSDSELTVLTLFQARHIEDIPELDDLRQGHGEVYPLLRDLMNSGVAFDILRNKGYIILTASVGFEQLAIRSADRFFEDGSLNDFEIEATRWTAVAALSDAVTGGVIGEAIRARTRAEFRFLSDVAHEPSDRPRFAFVHVPVPHRPIVFGPHGEPISFSFTDPYLDLSDPSRFQTAYIGQLEYLNSLVLESIDAMADVARPSVFLVMTDEGLKMDIVELTTKEVADSVRMLFAARVPDGEDVFGPAITPVNIFPILFDRYMGVDLPRQADRNFISDIEAPFEGFDIPNIDAR